MRVYIPLDWTDLPVLVRDRHMSAPVTAYAVTQSLRRLLAIDDEEELEECARMLAADAGLLRGWGMPCVVAADVEGRDVDMGAADADSAGEVCVRAAVPFGRIAAVLIADASGRSGAAATRDGDEEIDLLWYAPQEIDGLLSDG